MYSMCWRIARSARRALVAADRPDDRLMLADDQVSVDRLPEWSISEGWSTSRIQRVNVTSRSLPGRYRDRLVKASVGQAELVAGRIVSARVLDRLRSAPDRRLVGALRRQPGQRDLEEHPRLEQLVQRHALGLEHRRDRLAHVTADARVRRVLDEHPAGAALLHADQM